MPERLRYPPIAKKKLADPEGISEQESDSSREIVSSR